MSLILHTGATGAMGNPRQHEHERPGRPRRMRILLEAKVLPTGAVHKKDLFDQ